MNHPSEAPPPACACGPRTFDLAAWWRVGVGLLIAANSMTLSLAINTSEASPGEQRVVHGALALLALASLAILGWPLARNAARAAAERRITIEALFLAGIVGALVGSSISAVTGTGETYFEIVSIMLVVYLFGQQLTGQVQEKALRAATEWSPELGVALVRGADGGLDEVPVSELGVGSRVFVPPGQMVSADGVVEEGEGFVREAELTGEPFVAVKRPGDPVWAGTHCLDAGLTIRATSHGSERRIDRILGAVDAARATPSTLQAQADRLVSRFLPLVVLIAAVTGLVWAWRTGWTVGLFHAMAVLLVACPCALGLATPLAVWVAVARMAGRGLVVSNADAVEAMAAVDTVVFDKTGTLTEPRTRLVGLILADQDGRDRDDLLSLIEAVQRASGHPVASAFSGLARGAERRWTVVEQQVIPGTGVRARVRRSAGDQSTVNVVIGSAERLFSADDSAWSVLRAGLPAVDGAREVAVVVNGQPAAAAVVDESLRTSWPAALDELRADGLSTLVLTGDRDERARHLEADEVAAELQPEDKLARVQKLENEGSRVVFVGDGLNDAAAMAAAAVGVAVEGGSDLASEVADVHWHGGDLRSIPWALALCRSTVATMRSNLALAIGYNAIGITLAAAGVLHPVSASLLMTCSSLVVTWRATAGLQDEQTGFAAHSGRSGGGADVAIERLEEVGA